MENNNQYAKGTSFMLIGAIMVVVSLLIFYLTLVKNILAGGWFFLLFITIPLVINGFAYLVYNLVSSNKEVSEIVIPLVCLAVAIISAIIGAVSYVNDHNFILRGLEAGLLWFFISIPAFILAIIHFVASYIRMSKKVKATKADQ